MTKKRKTTGKTADRHNITIRQLLLLLLIFASIITIFFVCDLFDLTRFIKINLRFDWAMILCSFMSAVATIALGVVSLFQNKKLSELNEKSLEIAKISNGYSLIHFREQQRIEERGHVLTLSLFDTKGIPLKDLSVRKITLEPLEYPYVRDAAKKNIVLANSFQRVDLEYTPINQSNPQEFYYAKVNIKFPFNKYSGGEYFRLKMDTSITNVLNISTTYEYYILVKVANKSDDKIILENYYEFNYCRNIRSEDSSNN